MIPSGGHAAAWDLTRVLSPRARVRVADVDEYGRAVNTYSDERATSAAAPDRPWAVYLTDRRGYFRLLGFDLDSTRGSVEADAAVLTEILSQAGIRAVRCISGPGGGRHIWVGLADPVAAPYVRRLAVALSSLLPTLDFGLLLNPRTGCLRPPGAPHRRGTESVVVAGDVADLTDPARRAPAARVLRLVDLAEQLAGVTAAETAARTGQATVATEHTLPELHQRIAQDNDGSIYLAGTRRAALPAVSAAALHEPIHPNADASRVLARVLAGAAAAHWRLADLLPHLSTAPGLEHARTAQVGGRREPRPPGKPLAILRAQWTRVVTRIASQPRRDGAAADPTFEPREAAVVGAILAVQRRADAAPGRWARPGGPSDRRVLDALCDQILAAVATDIEADCRRLAILAGVAKSTATTALGRLAADGWVTRTGEPEGRAAARWAIPPVAERPSAELSTEDAYLARSQAVLRPPTPPSRASLRAALGRRLTDQAHDVWTPLGLGHHQSRTYAALTADAQTIAEVMVSTGYSRGRTLHHLDQLVSHRLAQVDRAGRWKRPRRDHRRRVARDLGADGTLEARATRYAIDRAAWAWWLDELAWRRSSDKQRRRSPGAGQLQLVAAGGQSIRDHHGAHPASGGRADFAAARAHLTTATSSRRAS